MAHARGARLAWYIDAASDGTTHLVERFHDAFSYSHDLTMPALCGAAAERAVPSMGRPTCPACLAMTPYTLPSDPAEDAQPTRRK